MLPLKKFTSVRKFGSTIKGSNELNAGVNLYCAENEAVYAIESGEVVKVEKNAVFIESYSGVIYYAKIKLLNNIVFGASIKSGQALGNVVKSQNPNLFIGLYKHEIKTVIHWSKALVQPLELINPDCLLIGFPEYIKDLYRKFNNGGILKFIINKQFVCGTCYRRDCKCPSVGGYYNNRRKVERLLYSLEKNVLTYAQKLLGIKLNEEKIKELEKIAQENNAKSI